MDYRFTSEEEAFKKEFNAWLNSSLPEGFLTPGYPLPDSWEERARIYREFQRKLFDAGYAGMNYPKKYGGREGTVMDHIIVTEGISPCLFKVGDINMIGFGQAGPTILTCGTQEQKDFFIPRLLNGEHIWCQGFSEPNAGSDLANVSTRAVREGDHYILNGQKVWTTMAHIADYSILLARTDPNSKRHKGLSYFLLDMKLPGITIRPIEQITKETEFNEVYFDDVRIPKDMMVGNEGEGWKISLTTLMYERVLGDITYTSGLLWEYENIVRMARKVIKGGRPVIEDPVIRQKLNQCYVELMVLRYVGYRTASKVAKGEVPGPESSIGKLYWSETGQRLYETALDIQGPCSQMIKDSPLVIDLGRWQEKYLYAKCYTIAAGASEIQRNIIAERVLGLPKDGK